MDEQKRKTCKASHVTLSQMMQPEMANAMGNIHGGWIMKLVDEAGGLACIRHSNHRCVTVAVDQMTFKHPIRIGDLVMLEAEVSYTGRTSMEAEVNVYAENVRTGQRWHTNRAYLVYVALGDDGNPTPVPPVIPESDEEKDRFTAGEARQVHRLKQARLAEKNGKN
ncbi:MAG: acyl-CoA thioesterase [Chloroflexi bacterium]|nr:acyl-CoA thioesterase [Chloroflexota bacterium]